MNNKPNDKTPLYNAIHFKWEGVYLDQGGTLTKEQRDQAFSEAMAALKSLELAVPEAQPEHVWGGDYPSADSYHEGYANGWNECRQELLASINKKQG